MGAPRTASVALGLLAVVVCAWLALGLRQSSALTGAQAELDRPARPSAAQSAAIAGRLDTAGTLNPDASVDLARAQLALERGDRAGAVSRLRAVVAREPANIAAWGRLAFAIRAGDPEGFAAVVRRIRALQPPVPGT